MEETPIGRIIFRAWRRGFREADLILGPFADRYVREMNSDELETFESLLMQEDRDLYAWITGTTEPPAEFATSVLERLQLFHRSLPIASGDISGS
jgi:antitoxin CptB